MVWEKVPWTRTPKGIKVSQDNNKIFIGFVILLTTNNNQLKVLEFWHVEIINS